MSRQRRRKSQQDGTLKGKCEVRFLKNCYAPIGYISIVTNDCYHRTLTATARAGTGKCIIHRKKRRLSQSLLANVTTSFLIDFLCGQFFHFLIFWQVGVEFSLPRVAARLLNLVDHIEEDQHIGGQGGKAYDKINRRIIG